MQAYGLYTHQKLNERKSTWLIIGLFFLTYLVGFGLALMFNGFSHKGTLQSHISETFDSMLVIVPIATIITMIWVFVGLKFNASMIASITDAKTVTRDESPELYNLLENLCISRGISMPHLMIIETDALNAFASGMSKAQYTVTVTTGLLNHLNKEELEAVLAHELVHIKNGDVKLMITAVLIVGILSFLGEMAFRSRIKTDNSEANKSIFIGMIILAIAGLFSVLIKFSLSRTREYLADSGAVELTKNPDAMISALLKISGRSELHGVPSGIMDMCIDNDETGWSEIFSTHPSITKRVQALQLAGGRLPSIVNRMPLPHIVNEIPASLVDTGIFGGKTPFS